MEEIHGFPVADTSSTYTAYNTITGDVSVSSSPYNGFASISLRAVVALKDGTQVSYREVNNVEPDTSWIVIHHTNGSTRYLNKDTVREVLVKEET